MSVYLNEEINYQKIERKCLIDPDFLNSKQRTWEKWNHSGQLMSKFTYLNNLKHGPYQKWTDKGELIEMGNYDCGKKDGSFMLYYGPDKHLRDGKIWKGSAVGQFRKGKAYGLWCFNHPPQQWDSDKFFQQTGVRLIPTSKDLEYLEELYRAAQTNGICDKKFENPEFGRDEVFKFIWGGQSESCGHYKDGQKDGFWRYHERNGDCYKQGMYKKGLKHGKWQKRKSKGGFECEYWKGKKHGLYQEYFKNSLEDIDSLRTGWFTQHKISKEGQWRNGRKYGKWIEYNKDGSVKKEIKC